MVIFVFFVAFVAAAVGRCGAGQQPAVPKFDVSTGTGAVAALQSPNIATRYLAWTALHDLQAKAEPPLRQLWQGHDAHQRARALQLLARIPGSEQNYIDEALKDPDPVVRGDAVAALRGAGARTSEALPTLREALHDPDWLVREKAAAVLKQLQAPQR